MGSSNNGGEDTPPDDKKTEEVPSDEKEKQSADVTDKPADTPSPAPAPGTTGPTDSAVSGGGKAPLDKEGVKEGAADENKKETAGPPARPAGAPTAAGTPGTPTSKLTVLTNIADKLTDVLNLGRVLSIGVPGCVAAFGLMMLVARFTTTVEIPAKTVVGAGRLAPDQVRAVPDADFMPELNPDAVQDTPDSLLAKAETRLNLRVRVLHLRDSLWAESLPTIYYDQLELRTAPRAVQFQMAKLRIAKDIETVREEKYWFVWLVLIVLLGCAITAWGYWHLLRRARLRDTWQYLVEDILPELEFGQGNESTQPEEKKEVCTRPTIWDDLDGFIEWLEDCFKDQPDNLTRAREAKDLVLRQRGWVCTCPTIWDDLVRLIEWLEDYFKGQPDHLKRVREVKDLVLRQRRWVCTYPALWDDLVRLIGWLEDCFKDEPDHLKKVKETKDLVFRQRKWVFTRPKTWDDLDGLVKLLERRFKGQPDNLTRAREAKDLVLRQRGSMRAIKKARTRPVTWRALGRIIDALKPYCEGDTRGKLAEIECRALAGRKGMRGSRYSWTNLHTPLMTGAQSGLEGMSFLDYLIKEYWRFVEFSVNLPIAVLVCLSLLGIYCFSLLPQCSLGWLGIVVSLVAALLLFLELRSWTDRVGLNQFDKYRMAVNGTAAGLMLLVRQNDRCLLDGFAKDIDDVEGKYLDEFKESLSWKEPKRPGVTGA